MPTSDSNCNHSLVDAYNQMMARIRDSIETAEAHAIPTLQKAIDRAKQEAIRLGEISLEEAEEVGNYIKRDINDAAEYLMETSHEFSEWLLLDIDIIEQKVLELFLSVADKTRVELEELSHPANNLVTYHSGEITGPGSLACGNCNELIQFNTTSHIPACPNCQHRTFQRFER